MEITSPAKNYEIKKLINPQGRQNSNPLLYFATFSATTYEFSNGT